MGRNEHFSKGHKVWRQEREALARKSRTISDAEHEDNISAITDALGRHPKPTGLSILKEGLESISGGSMDRARWQQLANLARSAPDHFEQVVWDARGAGFKKKQERAEARNKVRKANLAERAAKRNAK